MLPYSRYFASIIHPPFFPTTFIPHSSSFFPFSSYSFRPLPSFMCPFAPFGFPTGASARNRRRSVAIGRPQRRENPKSGRPEKVLRKPKYSRKLSRAAHLVKLWYFFVVEEWSATFSKRDIFKTTHRVHLACFCPLGAQLPIGAWLARRRQRRGMFGRPPPLPEARTRRNRRRVFGALI